MMENYTEKKDSIKKHHCFASCMQFISTISLFLFHYHYYYGNLQQCMKSNFYMSLAVLLCMYAKEKM